MTQHHIAVLGPIPRDHITTHHGEVIEKYGCAMHPAIGISKLLGKNGTVHLVSHTQKQDEGPIKSILADYINIEDSHITSEADMGDVIQLKFLDQNNRREQQTGFMNPILPEDVKDLIHCKVFVCVPITDYEVPLETIKFIKENSDAKIIFDAHGPTNAVDVNGLRHLRHWLDRDRWLPYIDVLKMNLEESHCAWYDPKKPGSPESGTNDEDLNFLDQFAAHALEKGVGSLIITLDSSGSAVYRYENGKVHRDLVDAIRVEHVVDTTGCGDSFAGGLGFGLLQDPDDLLSAVHYANALGAQRTQGRTFDVFRSKEETDQMIEQHYHSAEK